MTIQGVIILLQPPLSIISKAYLKHVYESLLSDNGISLQALKTCSSSSIVNDSSQETNNSSCDDNEQQLEVAYNLIFTSQYMIVVPRQSKAFKDAGASTYNQNIEINSFGKHIKTNLVKMNAFVANRLTSLILLLT